MLYLHTPTESKDVPPRYGPECALASLPQPLFILRPDRRLVFVNDKAARMFGGGQARTIDDRLASIGHFHALLIEQLLRCASGETHVETGVWFSPSLATGCLKITRLPDILSRSTGWPGDCLLMLVHVDEPGLTHAARIDALSSRCGLTKAERHVLMLLADGLAAQGVARQLEVRLSTVRTHIRNLLGKTQVPSLMQLLRRLGSARPVLE